MKRSLFNRNFKATLMAVPASALMLGAAQAGSTVGLNFPAWYYDSGVIPQMIGFGTGYQTTGFVATARAFGVDVADWTSTDPQPASSAVSGQTTFGNGLVVTYTAQNAWMSGIGETNAGFNASPGIPEGVAPGNNEVTWGYLDDGNGTTQAPYCQVSGLAAQFPHGYVVQSIAAEGGKTVFALVDFTDGVTTNTVAYSTYYVQNDPTVNPDVAGGTVGLSAPSGAFTSDSLSIISHLKGSGNRSTLAAFIITDQPVITQDPASTTVNQGAALSLSATVIGLTNALGYQWQLNGTPILGATNLVYTKASVTAAADSGNYALVATNLYGGTTSGSATVTVNAVAAISQNLSGGSSTIYSGANFSSWSVVASGALPLSYQWYRNGSPVAGATNATLTLSNVTAAATGSYAVTVANVFGNAKSSTNQLVVLAAPDLYTTDVAQSAPSAYWPLNEASGAPLALDYSGKNNNGTNTGGLTTGAGGPTPPACQGFTPGKLAYQFDGGSSYIAYGTGPSLAGTTDFTLEAWINTTATANGVILQQRSPTGYNGEYQLMVNASGTVNFFLYGGGYQFSGITSSRVVNDGLWHYVAFERSGTNGYLYIDGTLAGSGTGPLASLDPTIQTYVGADVRGSTSYFGGLISDVAIYPYALSQHTVSLHAYNGQYGNSPFSISFIPGGFVADTKPVGTLYPGVAHNVGWTNSITDANTPPVTRNGVAVFAGNSQITTPANPDFNDTNGTIIFWLQANAPLPGSGAEGAMLFDRRTTNGAVIVLHDDGSIFWQGQNGSQNAFSTGYVPDGNWHNIAVTYGQTTNDAITIYIDGAYSASVPVTNAWSWPSAQELEIGLSHDSYWMTFYGQMDDFRIYNRELSATEISTVYTSDALVDTSALKVRYNFDTAGVGTSLDWPVGALYSSPVLGAAAVWSTVTNAVPPYPLIAPGAPPSSPSLFYRAGF